MKKNIFYILAFFAVISCSEPENSYWFTCYPRSVDHMFLYSAIKKPVMLDDKIKGYEYQMYYGKVNSKINIDSFALEIWTHNLNIDSMISVRDPNYDELIKNNISSPIPRLEGQLRNSYIKHSESLTTSGIDKATPIEIEYRTDGVSNLKIYALDATLFGNTIGNSLNSYFEIGKYAPWFLASYESKSLLYGFFDKNIPVSIEEWLYNKPLAQPEMFLIFKQKPENLPVTTRFEVEMTLDNGKQLNDTSAYITIYK